MRSRKRTMMRIPSPLNSRQGRDRSHGPGYSLMIEILAARLMARGQSHDAHALDGGAV